MFDNATDLIDFDAYDDKELQCITIEISKQVELISTENGLFESYNSRNIPSSKEDETVCVLSDQEHPLERAKEIRREKKKKGDKTRELEKPISLTFEQKSIIALKELEDLRLEVQIKKDEWANMIDSYKVESY